MNQFRSKKILAVAVTALVLSCSMGFLIEESEETDALVPLVIAVPTLLSIIGVSVASGAALGFAAGWYVNDMLDPGTDTPAATTRGYEAQSVADSIMHGMAYYTNSLDNYAEVWAMTDSHQIRQAELAASYTWAQGESFDAYDVLTVSAVYENSSHMLFNAVDQVNNHFASLSQRMISWNQTPTYADKMTLQWTFGGGSMGSKSSFNGQLASVIDVTSASNSKAHLGGGLLWSSAASQITSSSGTSITLSQGWNDLDSLPAFEPDVFEFQSGVYAGRILSVSDAKSARINPGIVMESGSSEKLATYHDGEVFIDGSRYSDLKITILPEGASAQSYSVMAAMEHYEYLLREIESTIAAASSAASTVWSIYTSAGQASSYLTTLMVPNFFDNVSLVGSQQQVMTTLAMEQLSDYWMQHGGAIKTGAFNYSGGSMSLFLRADIKTSADGLLYKDVICTPFYHMSDQALINGDNPQTQPCIIAIWSEGESLTGWDATSNISDTALITIPVGSSIYVREMIYDGEVVNSVFLEQKSIDYIRGNAIDPNPLPDPPLDIGKWIGIVMIAIGIIAMLVGLVTRRIDIVLVGALLLVVRYLVRGWL